jgi:hypothetical protein
MDARAYGCVMIKKTHIVCGVARAMSYVWPIAQYYGKANYKLK